MLTHVGLAPASPFSMAPRHGTEVFAGADTRSGAVIQGPRPRLSSLFFSQSYLSILLPPSPYYLHHGYLGLPRRAQGGQRRPSI